MPCNGPGIKKTFPVKITNNEQGADEKDSGVVLLEKEDTTTQKGDIFTKYMTPKEYRAKLELIGVKKHEDFDSLNMLKKAAPKAAKGGAVAFPW